ncbi:hypothetical protein A4V12_30490 [Streptomyces noursei]|nr:hypothetical protein A4V12_30490 [Streptomyces noursei]
MNTYFGKLVVLSVVIAGVSAPITASFDQPGRTAVVADSGWGPTEPRTTPLLSSHADPTSTFAS